MHPFAEQTTPQGVVDAFWAPLRAAFGLVQRREDVFLAGRNDAQEDGAVWACSMGHFAGLFDAPWLGIRPTGRLAFVRYCEFFRVEEDARGAGRIAEICLHVDILGVMKQAGQDPLPPSTGTFLPVTPGPLTHDGILIDEQDPAETVKTRTLIQDMLDHLGKLNTQAMQTGSNACPPEELARFWADDMVWYGPAGIGATGLTIPRYQAQHQMPFRENLYEKTFHGHVARIVEGRYEAWFGWPNLTNKASGGFLGLPATEKTAEMRVVDVYRRDGPKLAENWVFIDLPHYLKCRGLDVLARNGAVGGPL